MGDINSYVNGYLSDKERFADLMNGVIFHGEKVVDPKDLSDLDTKIWKVPDTTCGAVEENIRDQLKCWNYKGKTFILGVEAEQNIQYAMPDHVHLLMEVEPQYGIHKAVKQIKGYSSKVLRAEFPWLKSRLPSLWTNSYFVSTVGGAPLAVIKQYIENQKNV